MIKIRRYKSLEEANLLMNGAVSGKRFHNAPFVPHLVGKTITFTSPAGSCEFAADETAPAGHISLKDIKAQLEEDVDGLEVLIVDQTLVFRAANGTAVTLGAADEEARALLGLGNGSAISGEVLQPPGADTVPRVITMSVENGTVYVLVDETEA